MGLEAEVSQAEANAIFQTVALKPAEISKQFKDQPIITEELGGAQFSVYRASRLHEATWQSRELQQLAMEARDTYKRYGDVPKGDEYDPKSAVYLTRIKYTITEKENEIPVEEWISMRFVPADGEPEDTEDLNFEHITDGQHSRSILEGIIDSHNNMSPEDVSGAKAKIVTISRIGAIRPYSLTDGSNVDGRKSFGGHHLRNTFTGLGFALMNKAFFEDARETGRKIEVVTAIMHRRLTDKILVFGDDEERGRLPFTDAGEVLSLGANEKVELDRNNPEVRYKHPGYFLDLGSDQGEGGLVEVLKSGIIPREVLERYIDDRLDEVLGSPKMNHFTRLDKLLLTNGPIEGTEISGEELRAILNSKVGDGPVLRIMSVPDWETGVNNMIEYARQSSQSASLPQ